AEGRYVAFVSQATNVVAGQVDTNIAVIGEGASAGDIFVRDRVLGTTRLVSGVNGSATLTGDGNSTSPSISNDGRYIAFLSTSTNLVGSQADEVGTTDAFVVDQGRGTTRVVAGSGGRGSVAGYA